MKPLVIAHRGASALAPENTLAAFALAFELGADGIELDVTLTKDGVPVVIHDDTVDRTTNGKGAIKEMTFDQVRALDAGATFGKFRGERVPELARVLDAFKKSGIVNIELKSTTLTTDGLESVVATTIERTKAAECVLISSFNPFALWRMRALNPRLPRGLLYAEDLPVYLRRAWLRPFASPQALHPKHTMVTPFFARWAHQRRYRINTWTVDEPNEMLALARMGIDAIITNKPDLILRTLEEQ